MITAAAAILLLLHRHRQRQRQRQDQRSIQIKTTTQPHTTRKVLSTTSALLVTILGLGGASIGDLYLKIPNEQAMQTLLTAHAQQITFYDTSPWYGVGLSEARFGLALHTVDRSSFVLQTKVGRYLVPDRQCVNGTNVGWIGGYHFNIVFDYTAAGFQRQMEDSLQRMGLGYVDSLVIHDLEPTPRIGTQEEKTHLALQDLLQLEASGYEYLVKARQAGTIRAFGAGCNSNEAGEDWVLKRQWNQNYVKRLISLHQKIGKIDFLLLANMFSLLNFEAYEDGILDQCLQHGIAVVIGGPYSSGILATGADPSNGSVPYYNYEHATDQMRERCRRVEKVCLSYDVPLIAAAIQFPLLHAAVVSVIPGGKNAWEVRSNVKSMNVTIPVAMWHALQKEDLLPKDFVLPAEV